MSASPRLAGLLFLAVAIAAPAAARAEEAAAPSCPVVPQAALVVPRFAEAVARGAVHIVAFGSSSTAGAGASSPSHAYPAQLERQLRRALPGVRVTVTNRGIGGEDARQMIARIGPQVLAESPDLVIWQLGANASLRSLGTENFRQRLDEGLAQFLGSGVDVVLMDNQRAPRIDARPGHGIYDAILRQAAANHAGVELFRRGMLMDALATHGVSTAELVGADGLHHTDRGYACVAEALTHALVAGLRTTLRQAGR